MVKKHSRNLQEETQHTCFVFQASRAHCLTLMDTYPELSLHDQPQAGERVHVHLLQPPLSIIFVYDISGLMKMKIYLSLRNLEA